MNLLIERMKKTGSTEVSVSTSTKRFSKRGGEAGRTTNCPPPRCK